MIKRGLHEKMYHSETNTFCYVRKSKIKITDSYEFIRHMHECQFNFVYLFINVSIGVQSMGHNQLFNSFHKQTSMRGSGKLCQGGTNSDNFFSFLFPFFKLVGEGGSNITIGRPKSGWCADDGPTLNACFCYNAIK